jgi:hypothetical protein
MCVAAHKPRPATEVRFELADVDREPWAASNSPNIASGFGGRGRARRVKALGEACT